MIEEIERLQALNKETTRLHNDQVERLSNELAALKRTTQLLNGKPFTENQLAIQRDVVRSVYQNSGSYSFEFNVLSNMNRLNMASLERFERNLSTGSKTNYCL